MRGLAGALLATSPSAPRRGAHAAHTSCVSPSHPPTPSYAHTHARSQHARAELGIDLGAILRATKAILLHQMRSPALDGLDFGGALVFLLALGGLHLLVGFC